MPNYLSRMKPNGANGTEYKLKDEELREAFDVFKEDIKGTQTATGNPITITDASETYAQGLSVELEPKQDLHGYDFPWVGGAGLNKIDVSPVTMQSDGYYLSNYTLPQALPVGTYTISIKSSSNAAWSFWVHDENGNEVGTASSASSISGVQSATFTTNGIGVVVGGYVNAATTLSDFMLESGSTAHSYEPYENICPISGYEGVEVEDVGKNEYDEDGFISEYSTRYTKASDGSVETVGTLNSGDVLWENTKGYTGDLTLSFKYKYANTGSAGIRPYVYYTDGTFETIWTTNTQSYNTVTKIFASGGKVVDKITVDFGSSTNKTNFYLQIEKGTTATPYEPYQSRTASVTFGQTVYGGVVNFLTGVLTVDMAMVDMGDLTYTHQSLSGGRHGFSVSVPDLALATDGSQYLSAISSAYVSKRYNDSWVNGDMSYYYPTGRTVIFINNSYTDASDFKTAMTGQTLCYELATPQTIQLTPQELKLLQDTNNITTNGTTITLDYIPNNSIGDAVKASEEYTDRAVERVAVAPKATLVDTWMISEESDTISVDLTSYDCNFFLLEYLFMSKRGTTLIPRPSGGSFSASVVTYNNGTALYIELDYNPTTKELAYTSNITSQFGILAIYTI